MTKEKDIVPEQPLNPEWMASIEQGVDEALDNYELFGQLNFSPLSITSGEDERIFPQLNPSERNHITRTVFQRVGFDITRHKLSGMYDFTVTATSDNALGKEMKGEVRVFETDRSETEEMYVHEIRYTDGLTDYIIAPRDFTYPE